MSKTLLVDAKYYGRNIRNVRERLRVDLTTAAEMLRVSRKEYREFERGHVLLPEPILSRLMYHAFVGLRTKHEINLERANKRK